MTTRTDPEKEIRVIVDDLAQHHPSLPRSVVEVTVREEWQSYATARVRDFVPVLVLRGARERLHA